jgi:hypothetical protein
MLAGIGADEMNLEEKELGARLMFVFDGQLQ